MFVRLVIQMENRMVGTVPTLETRSESNITTDKKRRYAQIIEIMELIKTPLSAKEIAVIMCKRNYIPTSERNFVSPRITELMQEGIVEQAGKKKCIFTNKKVTVFVLRGGS